MKSTRFNLFVVLAIIVCIANTNCSFASPFDAGDTTGSAVAVRTAIAEACEKAANDLLGSIPRDCNAIAVTRLDGDADGTATTMLEASLTSTARLMGVKMIGVPNSTVFDEAAMAAYAVRQPNGAVVSGELRHAEVDESGLTAMARLDLRLVMPATGQVGTFVAEAKAGIDPTTLALGMGRRVMAEPWFGSAATVGIILGVMVLAFSIVFRRRIRLVMKPREIQSEFTFEEHAR